MNDRRLDALARDYGMSAPRIIGTHDTRVVQVATDAGELAVKQFTAEEQPRAALEAALLAHLALPAPRYRVQTLLRTAAGEWLGRSGADLLLVTRWEAGQRKRYDELSGEEWQALGASLAALHDRLDDFGQPLTRLSEAVTARDLARERDAIAAIRPRALAHDPSRAQSLSRYLDDRLRLLETYLPRARELPDDPEYAIHNDYNQYNYLFDGRLPPVILDWGGAIGAPREYEVVRCLNHLPLVAPVFARRFIDGYRALRPLRPAALEWAVAAALSEHAVKQWPLLRWLADEPESVVRLDGTMPMVHALADGAATLAAFFAAASAGE